MNTNQCQYRIYITIFFGNIQIQQLVAKSYFKLLCSTPIWSKVLKKVYSFTTEEKNFPITIKTIRHLLPKQGFLWAQVIFKETMLS